MQLLSLATVLSRSQGFSGEQQLRLAEAVIRGMQKSILEFQQSRGMMWVRPRSPVDVATSHKH